ncbi:MAG: hypothetical protein J2P49_08260, partial [Methylocapsa sp.]|nr:hypothetical protein [Methylocapsa sp.]
MSHLDNLGLNVFASPGAAIELLKTVLLHDIRSAITCDIGRCRLESNMGDSVMAVKRGPVQSVRVARLGQPAGFTGTTRKIARYGWKPDLPDQRDFTYSVPRPIAQNIPLGIDLRTQCPPVYDQGRIGSCTANAIAAAMEFDMIKEGMPVFTPSRLFIYYNERAIEGTVGSDAGAQIRDGIKSVASQGDCPETEWPYDDTPANSNGVFPANAPAATQPTANCYADARKYEALRYQSVDQNFADL